MVVFGQKWLYSGKTSFIRAKAVALEQSACILGKSGCVRAKVNVFSRSG